MSRFDDERYWEAFREGRQAERKEVHEHFWNRIAEMECDEDGHLNEVQANLLFRDMLKELDLLDAFLGREEALR